MIVNHVSANVFLQGESFMRACRSNITTRMTRNHFVRSAFTVCVCLNQIIAPSSSHAAVDKQPSLSTRAAVEDQPRQWIFPQPERLVAIGDLHGDVKATREALRAARVLHTTRDEWVGGETVVVQVGDQLDRGDNELPVLALLHRLQVQASNAGGAVHILAGNHESMNARGNFRYATRGAQQRFQQWAMVRPCQIHGRTLSSSFEG